MDVIGIIAEYNPFHLGHAYQIKKIKEKYPDSIIIALISTCFTERGDVSIINKWDKTKICLENNIDLVIEFPTIFSTQSADQFSKYALNILNKFKINILAFGAETDDTNKFINLAKKTINNQEYDALVKEYLSLGLNYPTAMSKALLKYDDFKVEKPNDILALTYIKEIIKNNYPITPYIIKREDNYHSDNLDKIISANLIRKMYSNNKDISNYIVKNELPYLYPNLTLDKLFKLLKYKIITTPNLKDYIDINEGLENRIKKYINESNSWISLVEKIKTKRYTYNRINRTLLHIVLDIKNSDLITKEYIRILGFNLTGKKYLNGIKKDLKEDLYYKYKPNLNKAFDIENKCSNIYSLITNDFDYIKKEYQNRPIIK